MQSWLVDNRVWLRDHLLVALLSAGGVGLAFALAPEMQTVRVLTLGLGYVSLVLLVITLLIGPVRLFQTRRRNPVNLDLRRTVGIWAGITGVLHVVFGLQVHLGGVVYKYFFADNGEPLLNLFGISNYTGALALLLLALLLVLSNNAALRALKGKRWKNIQRWNYALFILTAVHTFGYQSVVRRAEIFVLGTALIVVVVLALQLGGLWLYRRWQT